ncbi:MAG: hypothetical protein ABR521_00180 [Gaiellaceae bacterium]
MGKGRAVALAAAVAVVVVPVALAAFTYEGSIGATDGAQTGRLFQDDVADTCAAPDPDSAYANQVAPYRYDVYPFLNPTASPQCVTVTLDPRTCVNALNPGFLFSVAYLAPFSPADVLAGRIADIGGSPEIPTSYSFTVEPGVGFDVVVHATTTGATCPSYQLTVDGTGIVEGRPTATRLLWLAAARTPRGVLLRWRTSAGTRAAGFHVYRERAGRRIRVSRAFLPASSRIGGGAYRWLDRGAPGAGGRYWVQAVGLDGTRSWHGPVKPPSEGV